MSSGLFADRPEGRPGLALFLNAGDPPFDVFRELVLRLDAHRVDCLELAVPFPNSPSDGPVISSSPSSRKRRLTGGPPARNAYWAARSAATSGPLSSVAPRA